MRFSSTTIKIILLILGLAAFGYHEILTHDFIRFDDPDYVINNLHVRQGITFESIGWAFVATDCGNWHPLTWLSHMLDCQLFGLAAAGHHFTSILLHSINSILLFLFLRQSTKIEWQSAMVAILFCIHPLHVESVAWAAERKDVLYTFFWLLALIAYVRYTKLPSTGRYATVVVLFILSLLSKPMAITFPIVLIILDWWPLQRFANQHPPVNPANANIVSLLWEKIPFIILSSIMAVITFIVQKHGGAVDSLAGDVVQFHAGNAVISYLIYIGKMLWPLKLSVFYPLDLSAVTLPAVACSSALLILMSTIVIKLRHQSPYLLAGWLWYIVTLFPVIGIVKAGAQSVADRYTYLPIVGLFVAIIWWISAVTERLNFRKQILLLSCVFLTGLLLFMTKRQLSYWRNTATLFNHAASVTNGNWMAEHVLGVVSHTDGDLPAAIKHYHQALQINPLYAPSWNNLGNLYRITGNFEMAVAALKEAIRLNRQYAAAIYNLGLTYANIGDISSASAQYNLLQGIDSNMASELKREIWK